MAYLSGLLPCCGKGACITQWNYDPCRAGPPMGHSGECWQNMIHGRREWQTTPVDLPMNCIKRLKYMTPKDESPVSEGVQYATRKDQRTTTNSSRKNEAADPRQKWPSVVDTSGEERKIWCYKEHYCIGTWNVRSMNQCKLDMVKQAKLKQIKRCLFLGRKAMTNLDSVLKSKEILFSWNIPPSPSPTESERLFYKSVSLFLFCI